MHGSDSRPNPILLRDAGKQIQCLFWGNVDGEGGLLCYTECCISMFHRIGVINRELKMESEKLSNLQKTNNIKCQSLNAIFRLRQDLRDERLTLKALMASMKATHTQSQALNNFVAKIRKQIQSCRTTFKILSPANAMRISSAVSSESDSEAELEIQEIRADLFTRHKPERQEYLEYEKARESQELEGCSREQSKTNHNEQEPEGEEDSVNTSGLGRPRFSEAAFSAANAARPHTVTEETQVPMPKLKRGRSIPTLPRTKSRHIGRRSKRRIDESRSTYSPTPRSCQFDSGSLSQLIQSRKAGGSVTSTVVSQQASQDINQITELLQRSTADKEQIDTSSLSRFIQSRKAGSTTSTPCYQASLSIDKITKGLLKKSAKVDEGDTMSLLRFVEDRKQISSKASTPSIQAAVSVNKITQQLLNKTSKDSKVGAIEKAMSDSGWVRKCLAKRKENQKLTRTMTNPWDQISISSKRRRRKVKRNEDTSSRHGSITTSTRNSVSGKRLRRKSSLSKPKSLCSVYKDSLIKEFFDEVKSSGGSRGFGARRKKKDLVFHKEFNESEMVEEVDSIDDYLRF